MFRDGVELGWTDRRRIGTCMRPCVFIYTFFFFCCVRLPFSRGDMSICDCQEEWYEANGRKTRDCIASTVYRFYQFYTTLRYIERSELGIFFVSLSLSIFSWLRYFCFCFNIFTCFFFLTLSFVRNLYWMHVYWVRFGVGAWCSFKKPNQRNWKAPSVKPRFMLCFGYNCLETKTHGDAWNINMRVPCPHLNTVDEILGESQKLTENYAEVATRTKQNISFHHWNQIRCIS